MAVLKIGKFEVAQQSGTAGTIENGIKYAIEHTGRAVYQKQARGICGVGDTAATAILTLTIAARAPFMTLLSNSLDVAWDTVEAAVRATTNAEKFRVTSSGKAITLKSSSIYTVNGNVGTFTNGLGLDSQHSFDVTVQFATNVTANNVAIPVLIEYYDGTAWKSAGTFTITQSSADADFVITSDPATLQRFANAGGTQTLAITSNKAYTIEKQGSDTAWFSIGRTTGTAGTADLKVTVVANPVAAAARTGTIIFKNPISGSTVLSIAVSQAAGDAYAISFNPTTIAFQNNELNKIKNTELTANASWQIEEVLEAYAVRKA